MTKRVLKISTRSQQDDDIGKLEKLRMRNEVVLRCAITHLFDVGWRNITPEAVERTIEAIREEEKRNKRAGKLMFVGADFQVAIMEMTLELKEFSPVTLLVYVSNYLRFCE